MDRLLLDVRIALRGFRRTPAFTAAVVAILALGIGMASTMTAVTDAVLRRSLPVEAPERVVALWPTRDRTEISLEPDDLERLRHDSRTMRAVAGFVHWGAVPLRRHGRRPAARPPAGARHRELLRRARHPPGVGPSPASGGRRGGRVAGDRPQLRNLAPRLRRKSGRTRAATAPVQLRLGRDGGRRRAAGARLSVWHRLLVTVRDDRRGTPRPGRPTGA